MLGDGSGVADGESDIVGVRDALALMLNDIDGVSDIVGVLVGVTVRVGVGVGEAVSVGVGVGVGEAGGSKHSLSRTLI